MQGGFGVNSYIVGVDIGTQGTKTCLYDMNGKKIASSFEESKLISPNPGEVWQEPDEIYNSVLRTIKIVLEISDIDPGNVVAVGLDGQMAGIMGVDGEFNAVTPYDSWLDTRCTPQIEKMKRQAEELIIKITGAPVSYAHGPKIIWWKETHPEVYKEIQKFVTLTSYIVGRMCNLNADQAYIDYTCLHFSGFGDVKNLKWSDELLDIFDVEKEKMPRIVEPWEIVGKLSKEAALLCGLKEGTPVVAGAGDQAATSLGAGIVSPGLAFDVAGTASVFSFCVDKYAPDIKNKTVLFPRSIIKDLWIPLAYINGGGLCLRWMRNILACGNPEIDYQMLDKEAEGVAPGSEGLIFVPHFDGRVCPNNPYVHGSFTGLTMNHTRKHMYRSILEGIGYEYKIYMDILKELTGLNIDEVYVIGGGSRSMIFNQIKSDILGVNYTVLDTSDTATLGSAIVAGYAVGLYTDLASTASNMVNKIMLINSNKHNNKLYKKYADVYPKIIDSLENIYKALS